jgi:hypothetical protein
MSAKTNISNVVTDIHERINSLKAGGVAYDMITRKVATSTLSEVVQRVHTKGLAADGSLIGHYSKEPIYVSASSNVGSAKAFGTPEGKSGETKFKNGQPHKSKYFAEGYNEFKTTIGRNEIGSVNLTLSGLMQNSLQVIPKSHGYGLGYPNSELLKRAIWFEQTKYKKQIYALTSDEKETVISITKYEVRNALFGTNSN